MINYTLAFVFHESMKFMLTVTKQRPAWQAGRRNGIGGKVEAQETPAEAAVRELFEEANVNLLPIELTPFGQLSGDTYKVHLFAACIPKDRYMQFKTMTDEKIESLRVRDILVKSCFQPDELDRDLAYLTCMARLALEPGQSLKAVVAR